MAHAPDSHANSQRVLRDGLWEEEGRAMSSEPTYLVEMSAELVRQLEGEWSQPCQIKITSAAHRSDGAGIQLDLIARKLDYPDAGAIALQAVAEIARGLEVAGVELRMGKLASAGQSLALLRACVEALDAALPQVIAAAST